MQRMHKFEQRLDAFENRSPFTLRYFVYITIKPGHDVFDRAEAAGEYFIREDGESENDFIDRIKQSTDTNPIWVFPQSYEPRFKAQRMGNAAQLNTPVKPCLNLDPATNPSSDPTS